jgi:UDP-glucose 4-epimerase
MTVWITGAGGFMGRYLARELANAGHAVHGIGHGALTDSEKKHLGLRIWLNGEIDATNLNALAVHGLPSKVFHLAGGSSVGSSIVQPLEDFSRNVASTARLLEWLRGSSPESLVIAVSSAAVYGANHHGPISESTAPAPMSPYGAHKLMMEQLCQSYSVTFGMRTLVARLFSVYGQELRKQLLWDVCSRLQQDGQTLVLGGTGAEIRDWTDVRDIARLLTTIADLPQPEKFHIINGGSGRGTSVAEIASMLVRNWGADIAVRYSGVVRPGDPPSLLADDTLLRRLSFNWQISLERGIADYVKWFKGRVRD